jgi:hypothetical protein
MPPRQSFEYPPYTTPLAELAAPGRALGLLSLALPQQLRQPGDVDRNAPRFVLREHVGLPSFGLGCSGIDVGDRLPVRVTDAIAAGYRVGAPGWREAAG